MGVAADLGQLIEIIDKAEPDVVVTDIRMPPTSTDEGIRAANHLRDTRPATGVVVLSQYANPDYALALLERGSAGRAYLLKERVADVEELFEPGRYVRLARAFLPSAAGFVQRAGIADSPGWLTAPPRPPLSRSG